MTSSISSIVQVLIIGRGSIGQRHGLILKELGCVVKFYSRRNHESDFICLEKALEKSFSLIVIATETANHVCILQKIRDLGYQGHVLVEKPLFSSIDQALLKDVQHKTWVGYNLRFHPIIQQLKKIVNECSQGFYYAHFHVGQSLSTWRPQRDALSTYSAFKKLGGGVLLDLSHEIDLAHWLFGEWGGIQFMGRKCSQETIDSEDLALILAKTKDGQLVSINLNYLDKVPTRFIQLSSHDTTIFVDLINSSLKINHETVHMKTERNQSYKAMWHEMLNVILGLSSTHLCTYTEGITVLNSLYRIQSDAILQI